MYASQSLLLFYLDDGWLGAQNHAVLGRPWFGRGAAHSAEKPLLSYAGALRLRPGSKIVRAVGNYCLSCRRSNLSANFVRRCGGRAYESTRRDSKSFASVK
ncbi:hypothetical protein MCOR27_005723 [Pyricularia oryzae]|uniref:Uncharacterized protein n=1 Tax=Pyricularia grisea TaxID=148305 RepID=A0ABQ8NU92_PYRGI|nr:hypothetical protein MCOR01_002055 [Pyricularia oryzae]KAI6302220.1 hypothetical protein MCOR33_002401 [Pyricularia grisea]KAH9429357.1 hypothetical protein MCOR02_010762 [Pyricularia oryzae]KAI6263799.1 hypothetical protein MCOR19_000130 [Pyricularia oryzae]KAI6272617.1 hypothetical protein MCOR26_007249 [Pyricularia oryzae]